jgi:pimeloyl-ACP methyl ester carboxylesterase
VLFDFAGRGESSWLDLKKHYHYYVYIKDSLFLLKSLPCKRVHWLGTSMGGIVGMILAACFPKRILSLVLNDIGPEIPKKFLGKMKQYIDLDLKFSTLQQVVDYGKNAYSRLGISTDEDWLYFSNSIVRKDNDTGLYNLKYDPLITNDITHAKKHGSVSLWFWWNRVKCPVLLISGSDSEVLLSKTIKKMKLCKNRFEEYKIFGAGHFPILFKKSHINRVLEWIDSQDNQKI